MGVGETGKEFKSSGQMKLETKMGEIGLSFRFSSDTFGLYGTVEGNTRGIDFDGAVSQDRQSAMLLHMDIEKVLQGKGVGVEVLTRLDQALKEHGVRELYALFDITGQVKFLLREGFQVVWEKREVLTAATEFVSTRLLGLRNEESGLTQKTLVSLLDKKDTKDHLGFSVLMRKKL